jgi:TonB family protein
MFVSLALVAALQASNPRPLNTESWVAESDYPPAALRHNEQGVVAFELQIDAAGRVALCTVTHSSGSVVLDARTCALIQERARFEPARDARGNAVAGSFRQRIGWQLPPPARKQVAPWSSIARMVISGTGEVLSCTESNIGPASWGSACDTISESRPEILLAFRGGPGPAPATVVHEAHFVVEGISRSPRLFEQSGRQLISMIESRFDIDAEGAARNCRVVQRGGSELLQPLICDHMFDGPYEATDGRSREAGVVIALSVEGPERP